MHSSEIPRVGTDDDGANATAPESRARIVAAMMISIRGIMLIITVVCCSRSCFMIAFLLHVSEAEADARSDFVICGDAWCFHVVDKSYSLYTGTYRR